MTYKLINRTTGEKTMCSKVVINGFDYYVSNTPLEENNVVTDGHGIFQFHPENPCQTTFGECKRVIATNNPSIDLPKVVDIVVEVSHRHHPNSDEDMIELIRFIEGAYSFNNIIGKWYLYMDTSKEYTTKELLQIWKEQKPKIVYYE